MKTEEDEAFDDLAKRQGSWVGGYQAKRKMAADKFIAAEERKVGERYGYVPKLHPSEWINDHNEDNLDMVAQPAQEVDYWIREATAARQAEMALRRELEAQPAQEPVAWADLLKEAQQIVESKFLWKKFIDGTPLANDIAFWMVDFAQQYTVPPLPAQPAQEPVTESETLKLALEALEEYADQEGKTRAADEAITAIKVALAQPAQRQWIWLSDADIADVIDTTCQYTCGYEEFLIKKAERKIRSMNNG